MAGGHASPLMELSLRHLPELSEDSFQIPTAISVGDLLMADESDLFFQVANETLSTPVPERHKQELTLEQPTPKPAAPPPALTLATSSSRLPRSAVLLPNSVPDAERAARKPEKKIERANDMFERKKRDSNLQKGVDLSTHSTRCLPLKLEGEHPVSDVSSDWDGPADTDTALAFVVGREGTISSNVMDRLNDTSGASSSKIEREVTPEEAAGGTSSSNLMNNSEPLAAQADNVDVERPTWDDIMAESSFPMEKAANVSTNASGGGVAERLVLYSQKFMSSIGLFNSQQEDMPTAPITPFAATSTPPLPSSVHDPLTLSQISPRKAKSGPGRATAASPMRPSTKRASKRPAGETEQRDPKRSRRAGGKPDAVASTDRGRRVRAAPVKIKGDTRARSNKVLQASRSLNAIPSSSESSGSSARAVGRSQKKEPAPSLCPPAVTNAVPSTSGTSDQTRGRSKERAQQNVVGPSLTIPVNAALPGDRYRVKNLERSERERASREKEEKEKRSFKASGMPYFDKASATLPPPKPTIPQEFHFQSDIRVEARRHEFDDKLKTWQKRDAGHHLRSVTVPDFKALHAAQEALTAARKELIVPVIPVQVELSTEARVKEREKFEEARRTREREIERQMEERRLRREEEEERELKELRKRAVPRANAVPDWYADAPKKNSKSASRGASDTV